MQPLKPFDPVVIAPFAMGVPAKTLLAQAFHGATNRVEPRRIEVLKREGLEGRGSWMANRQRAFEQHAAERFAAAYHSGASVERREYAIEVRYPRLEFSGDRVIERKRVHFNPVVTVRRLEPKAHAAPERTPDIKPPSVTRTHTFRYAEPAPRHEARDTREQVQPPPKTSIIGKLLDLLARLVSR